MLKGNPNAFCASPLDKAGVARKDEAWVEAQRRDPAARLCLFYRGELLIERGADASRIQWLTLDALTTLSARPEPVLLGLWDAEPIWAADVSDAGDPPFADLGSYAPLRAAGPYLPAEELAVAGQAHWLLEWHRTHQRCAREGDPTVPREGGLKRVNERTGTEHFPRTDPVAIVLPYKDDRVCLGRGPHFPQGFMSAFAGYLEPGETLEECGARELYEEAGLRALSMDYVFSQPWPFPSSLMMGFLAEVEGTELTLDPAEIEEARWFSRDEIRRMLSGEHETLCPPPMAIAHQLMKHWLSR